MSNLNREVWTPQAMIDALTLELDMIMDGQSWHKPFTSEEELFRYIVDNQPYYKKPIEEVNEYFADRYGF